MTFEEADKILAKLCDEEFEISRTKGREYTQGDRLDNFKRIGMEVKCSHCHNPIGAKAVWWVYFKKHVDSILSYINTGAVFSESIKGRIIDDRVYLFLLWCLIEEENS